MKYPVLLLALLLLIPAATAHAQWKTEHTALAVVSSAAITADWFLTANAVRRGGFQEENVILGGHPSVGQVNTYSVLVLGGNLAIGRLLPGSWRTLWFTAITAFESAVVLHQVNIGLQINALSL